MIVERGGLRLGGEGRVVVYNIQRVGTRREVAFCADDGSDGVADSFVRPLRELQCIEGLDWEGGAMDQRQSDGWDIEAGAKRQGARNEA